MINREPFNPFLGEFLTIGRTFVEQQLPLTWEKFNYLFESIFIFEFLLKNFRKITNSQLSLFGANFVDRINGNLKYDDDIPRDFSVISGIQRRPDSFLGAGSSLKIATQLSTSRHRLSGFDLRQSISSRGRFGPNSRVQANRGESSQFSRRLGPGTFESDFPFQDAKEFLFALFDKNLDTRRVLDKAKQVDMLSPELASSAEFNYLGLQCRDNFVYLLSLYVEMYKGLLRYLQRCEKSQRKLKNHLNRMVLVFQSLFKIVITDACKTTNASLQLLLGIRNSQTLLKRFSIATKSWGSSTTPACGLRPDCSPIGRLFQIFCMNRAWSVHMIIARLKVGFFAN